MIEKIKKQKKTPLSLQIEADLLKQVKTEAKKKDIRIRQIVEAGFRTFLEECQKNEKEKK